jgi:hypothetical protein
LSHNGRTSISQTSKLSMSVAKAQRPQRGMHALLGYYDLYVPQQRYTQGAALTVIAHLKDEMSATAPMPLNESFEADGS